MVVKFYNKTIWLTVLIFFLLLTNLISLYLLNGNSNSQADQPIGNSLLDPARPLYTDENLVTNIEPLRDFLKSLPEREKDKADISIYFEVLTTGANISVNPDLALWPASLAKLPLAMVIMKKIEEGTLSEDEMLVFEKQDEDPTESSGIDQVIGKTYSVKDLLQKLLVDSSNVSYSMLKRQVTSLELNSIVNSVGLEQLFTPEGKVSAKEYSRLFRSLYVASYLNPENSQKLLAYMQSSQNLGFIKAGLPKEVSYAHKWGENSFYNVHSDAGIVYAERRPYLISVMIAVKQPKVSLAAKYAQDIMKEISEKSYVFVKDGRLK